METFPYLIPHSEPFLFPGNKTACILIHGFTSTPEEMQFLGHYLHGQGYTVLGLRLAGHGTHPRDLARTVWTDWLVSVEEGLALLKHLADCVFLIGQSMGGMVSLTAAARYPVAGVITLSTPFFQLTDEQIAEWKKNARKRAPIPKQGTQPHAELGIRREAGYPAYAATPPNIYLEVCRLQKAMEASLPRVACPTFIIQSRHDAGIPPDSLDQIVARLPAGNCKSYWLEHFVHSVVRDLKRSEVFQLISQFF